MIESTIQPGFTGADFSRFLDSRDEPDWLVKRRRTSWDRFEKRSWPSRRDEEWIRTDIRLFKLDRFSLPIQAAEGLEPVSSLLAEDLELGGQSISMNSHSLLSTLSDSLKSQGVVFGSIGQLMEEHGELIEELFCRRQGVSPPDHTVRGISPPDQTVRGISPPSATSSMKRGKPPAAC